MDKAGLPKILGLKEATAVVVGSMIGSGIFLKAAGIASILPHPPLILLCWLLAGLLTLSGALVLAELSARFPEGGGPYVFLSQAYGPWPAFLFGWSLLALLQSGSIAAMACGMARQVAARTPLDLAQQQALAYVAILALTLLHCLSVNVGLRWLQNGLTLLKYLCLLGLVALGLAGGQAQLSHFVPSQPLPPWGQLLPLLGAIMLKSLWAYDGWANATFMAGEVREARSNLPKALVGGTLVVLLAYLALNGAYHLVLPAQELAQSPSAAVSLTERTLGPGWSTTIAAMLAVSIFGTLNSSIASAPRVYFAMAQAGQFPTWMARQNRFHTPYVALVLQGVWAMLLIALWQDFERITDNVIFVYWIFYALCALGALRFPPPTQGYRAPFRGVLVTLFVTGAAFVVISQLLQEPQSSLQALLILGLGALLYRAPHPKDPG